MMKKFLSKRYAVIAMTLATVTVVMPVVASAKNETHAVVGSGTGISPSANAHFTMNVTAGLSASISASDLHKNTFTYQNDQGVNYSVDVRFSSFSDTAAWFTGPSSESDGPEEWVVIMVEDHGQSKDVPDSVSIRITPYPSAAFNMVANHNSLLFDQYEIRSGNVTVK